MKLLGLLSSATSLLFILGNCSNCTSCASKTGNSDIFASKNDAAEKDKSQVNNKAISQKPLASDDTFIIDADFPSGNMPFGTAWNTAENYGQQKSCSRWAEEQPGICLAATIEIPYTNVGKIAVSDCNARNFGCNLARALHKNLSKLRQ
jgi:hypothetical protein